MPFFQTDREGPEITTGHNAVLMAGVAIIWFGGCRTYLGGEVGDWSVSIRHKQGGVLWQVKWFGTACCCCIFGEWDTTHDDESVPINIQPPLRSCFWVRKVTFASDLETVRAQPRAPRVEYQSACLLAHILTVVRSNHVLTYNHFAVVISSSANQRLFCGQPLSIPCHLHTSFSASFASWSPPYISPFFSDNCCLLRSRSIGQTPSQLETF